MTAIRTDDGNSKDHWVPQFYLRRWITGPEKKLSAFWRKVAANAIRTVPQELFFRRITSIVCTA